MECGEYWFLAPFHQFSNCWHVMLICMYRSVTLSSGKFVTMAGKGASTAAASMYHHSVASSQQVCLLLFFRFLLLFPSAIHAHTHMCVCNDLLTCHHLKSCISFLQRVRRMEWRRKWRKRQAWASLIRKMKILENGILRYDCDQLMLLLISNLHFPVGY